MSELIGEHIPQFDFQLVQNRFQLVKRQMVFPALDAMQCGVGNADLFAKVRIRKAPPRLAQKLGKLAIQMTLHPPKLANYSSRMRDDFCLLRSLAQVSYLTNKIVKNLRVAASQP